MRSLKPPSAYAVGSRSLGRLVMLALVTMTGLGGCAGAAAGAIGSAAINTAMAGTVSAVRRANGDCFTVCNPGSTCNKSTGMCDPLPCGGLCNFDQKCESTYLGDKCVSVKAEGASIK